MYAILFLLFSLFIFYIAIQVYVTLLVLRAELDVYDHLSFEWQVEELTIQTLSLSKSPHIQALFNSLVLTILICALNKFRPVERSEREEVIAESLILRLMYFNKYAEKVTREFTREELQSNWSYFAELSDKRREYYESFRDSELPKNYAYYEELFAKLRGEAERGEIEDRLLLEHLESLTKNLERQTKEISVTMVRKLPRGPKRPKRSRGAQIVPLGTHYSPAP